MSRTLAALLLCAGMFSPSAPERPAPEYGPPKGTLVIVGGGDLEGTGILEKFIEMAGASNAKLVIVPTADGNRDRDGSVHVYDRQERIKGGVRDTKREVRGSTQVDHRRRCHPIQWLDRTGPARSAGRRARRPAPSTRAKKCVHW